MYENQLKTYLASVHSPTGSISFIFTYVFAEKCTRWRLAPPPIGWRPQTGNPGSASAGVCFCIRQNYNPITYLLSENIPPV